LLSRSRRQHPLFAPDVDPAMLTAITAEVAMLRDRLKAGGG
jgi:hypothetical protein